MSSFVRDCQIIYDTTCIVKKVLESVIDGECDVLGSFEFKMPNKGVETPLPEQPAVWTMTEDEKKVLEARSSVQKPKIVNRVQPSPIERNHQQDAQIQQRPQQPAPVQIQNEAELEAKMMSLAQQIAQAVHLHETSIQTVPPASFTPVHPAYNMMARKVAMPPMNFKQQSRIFPRRSSQRRSINYNIPPPPGFGPYFIIPAQPPVFFRPANFVN